MNNIRKILNDKLNAVFSVMPYIKNVKAYDKCAYEAEETESGTGVRFVAKAVGTGNLEPVIAVAGQSGPLFIQIVRAVDDCIVERHRGTVSNRYLVVAAERACKRRAMRHNDCLTVSLQN